MNRKFQLIVITLIAALVSVNALAASSKKSTKARATEVAPTRSEAIAITQNANKSPLENKLELEPNFGFAFVSPGEINTFIRDQNDKMQKQGAKSFNVSEIGMTASYGFAATYRLIPQASFGLAVNHLGSTSDGSAKVGDNSLNGKYSIGATMFTAESRITVYQSEDRKFETIAAPFVGVGFYNASLEFTGSALANGSISEDASAKSVVFGTTLGGRYWVMKNLALGLNAGYRYAKSGDLKVDAQKNTTDAVGSTVDNNGRKVNVDASSMLLGTQLTWTL